MATPDQFVHDHLALLAWREGRAGSLNLMNAIMLVHANRVATGVDVGGAVQVAGDWMADFRMHRTFSPWFEFYGDELDREWPDLRDPFFQAALHAAPAIYDGAFDILTDGAKFYAPPFEDSFYNPQGWFHKNIVEQPTLHPRTATISGWSFYR